MIAKARLTFIRMSPRKMRLVADLVRDKRIDQAQAILENTGKRATFYIAQVLKAAVASAVKNAEANESWLRRSLPRSPPPL